MSDQIQDGSKGGRKYFGTIPHMAGAKLDVYEHRLYCHYIEVCGVSKTDECYQAEKTIYTACDMSKQRFHKARQGLIDKKFVTFRPGKPNKKGQKGYSALTTILDIWPENIEFCKSRSYRGKILPVEGVNNYPLKGPDITPNKKYKNIKEESTLSAKTADAQNADGIELDTDGRLTEESWRKIDGDGLTDSQKILLGNIYHSPMAVDHVLLQDKVIRKNLDVLLKLDYVWMNSGRTYYVMRTEGNKLMEALKQDTTDATIDDPPQALTAEQPGGFTCCDCTGTIPNTSDNFIEVNLCKSCMANHPEYTGQPATVADLVAPNVLELDAAIYDGVPLEHPQQLCEVVVDEPEETPAPKAKPETPHTAMKNALVSAMGYTQDDITCWGEYNKASKNLRQANITVDEIPALHAFSWALAAKGNYKFKSPQQLAKDLPEYRKVQRAQVEQLTREAQQDDSKPMSATEGVVRFEKDGE